MKATRRWFALALVIGLVCQSGVAGTILGTAGKKFYPPTSSSPANTITVYGDWIENIDRVSTTASGVTVAITSKLNGAQNNTGEFRGKGAVNLRITTNNASLGNKTIRLIDDPILGVGGTTFNLVITVVEAVSVTNVNSPSPPDPFKEIVVTLQGTGLQEAADPSIGAIVKDNLVPLVTVGGNASVSSVRVLSSSASSLQAKIFFSNFIQDATVDLTLRSTNTGTPLGAFGLFKTRVRVKSANLKNYVESITFPNGNTFDKNSIATIHINLLFPAPGGGPGSATVVTSKKSPIPNRNLVIPTDAIQLLRGNALDNSRVWVRLVPSNAFVSVPGGTPIVATGATAVVANSGDNIIPITVKVADCLGGQPGQTNVVKIQTWMHNQNTTNPPDFVEQTFNVRCIQ